MNSSFFHATNVVLLISIFFIILSFFSIINTLSFNNEIIFNGSSIIVPDNTYIDFSNSYFLWPTPGYTYITSHFGYRNAPTSGASNYHSGVDIGAPEGASIFSISSGTVSYVGFSGAGGFTVTVKYQNYTISYCHVSPNFLVSVGEYVIKGTVIAKVGPKNVYGVPNNPYKDSSGKPTNGATTGSHLHLTIKKDGKAVNPLDYISSSSS